MYKIINCNNTEILTAYIKYVFENGSLLNGILTKNAIKHLKRGCNVTCYGTLVECPGSNNREQKTEVICDQIVMYGSE